MHLSRNSLRASLATSALVATLLAPPFGAMAQDAGAPSGSVAALASLSPETTASSLDGSTRERALSLELDGSYEAALSADASVWFAVDLPRTGSYGFDTEGSDCDTVLELYDAASTRIAVDDDGGSGVTSRIQHELATGRVYLRVHGFSDSTSGNIVCSANASSTGGGSDHTHELHAGYTLRTELEPSSTITARFQAATRGIYVFSTAGSDFDTVLSLHSADGQQQLAQNDDGSEGVTSHIQQVLEVGAYQLRARGFSESESGALVLAADLVGAGPSAGSGAGDSRESAIAIAIGQPYSGLLESGQARWFALQVGATTSLRCATQGSDFDTVLHLHDADGNELASDDDGGEGASSRLIATIGAGQHYVRARGFGDAAGQLVLLLDVPAGVPAAAAVPAEQDGDGLARESAFALRGGQQMIGELGRDESRWFRLELDGPQSMSFSTNGSGFDTVLRFCDAQGNEIASDDDGGEGTASQLTQLVPAGVSYVELAGFGGSPGSWVLSVTGSSAGSSAGAITSGGLTLGQTHSSQLDANGEVDMPFHATRPGRYVFSTEGSDFDTILTLQDNRGNTLASDDDGGEGTTSRIEQVLAPGEYLVVASGFSSGSGQLLLTVTNAAGSSRDPDPIAAGGDGSTRSSAIQMSGDHRESGSLQGGAELWFSVQVQIPAIWEFSTGGSDFDTVLALHDPAGNQVARDDDGGGGTSSLLRHNLTAGLWLVQLSDFGQSGGSYQLAGEAFSGLGLETLTLGQPHATELSAGQELEFEISVAHPGEYSISTEGSDFDTVLSLHDVLGTQLASDDDGGSGTTSLITQDLEMGNYLVRVRGFSSAAAGSLILVASAEPVRLQPRRLRAAQGIEPEPAPSDGAGTGSGAADYDAVQLENAQLNLRVVELEVESQTRAAAADLQAARFVVEESRRALESFVEHEAPLEVARQQLAIDRARAGVELASAELQSIQAKMDGEDSDLAELNAHLRPKQQELDFARRELELAEVSMDVLAEIEIARRQRKLEQGVAEASAELEAAERALEVAELLGQIAINEAQHWIEALRSMPAESADSFEFQIF